MNLSGYAHMDSSQDRTSASFPQDCLPPEGEYQSRDALFQAINAWASSRGYAFINGRSTREKTGRQTITFMCDRRRNHPILLRNRQRMTTTRTTGCEFSVLGKESRDKRTWTLRHRPDQRFSQHNHGPSQDATAHPILRALSTEDLSQLQGLSNAGIAPKEIRTYMRQNTDTIATQQDIYNRIADARRQVSQGQSSINALADHFFKEGFWSQFQTGPDGRVRAVVFAHPDSVAYLQAYPDVLIMDCTYKTNKYGMPLLDLIGVDACQRSFCVAFGFLSGEGEEDYLWALDRFRSLCESHSIRDPSVILTDRCIACMNAVATCFPSSNPLLCLWHANKAVLRYCQPRFMHPFQGGKPEMEDWNEFYGYWHWIIKSPSEEIFHERVSEFEKRYLPDHAEEARYVKATWLDPYKEKLVKAWVNQHSHFDNVVTSRVEGIHWLLKSHIKVSTLDLFQAWRSIKHALLNQLAELRANQAKQRQRTPIELSGVLYGAVQGWVSHEALRKVEQQRKLLIDSASFPLSVCTGSFTRSQGLPCVHKLESLLVQGQALQLEDFHPHWHLTRKNHLQPMLEPRQRIGSATVGPSLPLSSVRRDRSGFETVETARPPRAPPLCSNCHIMGHRSNSKECPLRCADLGTGNPLVVSLRRPQAHGKHVQWIPFTVPEQPQLPSMITPEILAWRPVLTCENIALDFETDMVSGLPLEEEQADRDCPNTEVAANLSVQQLPADEPQSPGPFISHPSALSPPSGSVASPNLRYDDPRAIHQRYVASRDVWYKTQPPGTLLSNRQYRKAMGLPLGYSKSDYTWCMDYKQMGRCCITSAGSREWTKEELMAYLDWDKLETDRIEARVAQETEGGRLLSRKRGMGHLWEMAQQDIDEQEASRLASGQEERCIVVQL